MSKYECSAVCFLSVLSMCISQVYADCLGSPSIESPAPAAQLDHDASVSCSGGASDSGVSWSCKITDSGTKWNKVTGSSTCVNDVGHWSGTVPLPNGNPGVWTTGDATAVYKEDGEEVASEDFEFILGS